MTTFQLVSFLIFLGAAAVGYRKELAAVAKRFNGAQVADDGVKQSIAVTIVNDLIAITELRDKLAAEDCPEGVEACTNLLRVIVEQTKPASVRG